MEELKDEGYAVTTNSLKRLPHAITSELNAAEIASFFGAKAPMEEEDEEASLEEKGFS